MSVDPALIEALRFTTSKQWRKDSATARKVAEQLTRYQNPMERCIIAHPPLPPDPEVLRRFAAVAVVLAELQDQSEKAAKRLDARGIAPQWAVTGHLDVQFWFDVPRRKVTLSEALARFLQTL